MTYDEWLDSPDGYGDGRLSVAEYQAGFHSWLAGKNESKEELAALRRELDAERNGLGKYSPERVNKMFYEQQATIAALEARVSELESERRMISDYCWKHAGGKQRTVAGDIFRYLNQEEKLTPPTTQEENS